ncbi:exodeoxyribonuclease VII small subunit [Ruminococcus sp.]|uniref:exodeoxyribonuclease VII small subunit n=1 Tax=Ruminococcus sp. TaxID=41978 RepID=UPI0025DE67D3|nr:exodeoxyribonuclease VII small subunit [Ruminococcus sp.]MCI5816250.1 exodeoxyribonuclease VII small subunit [Ruminococcus sp.]MDD7556630.1 exodeoxyribonuclease VII small subunit [Ruminococcus sp.]MDY4964604.1 exodeoxyribonuclease VII small subunit [Ruminococcus callidus]
MEFEQNMARLLEIVTKLEQGDLTLEESVALYEEGIKLSEACSKALEQAKLKVTIKQEEQGS